MLGVIIALLLFGGYFTVRTLRTELAVAQLKSDFVSTVSHEFRSPLAGINQLGEMLRDGRVKDEPTRQRYYEMIVRESQRLRRLVENVLDFSRMEEGRKRYRLEPFEPAPWLRQLSGDFQEEVASAGFQVQATVPEDLPVLVGDREALTTAVHNLLDNAAKYSRNSKTLWLEASANGDGLSVTVRDRGVGISEQDKPHIFEKFYRGGGDLKQQVKGAGLGLNLVRHIVTAHGGSVDFESQEGQGSAFTVHLKAGT
jgi:signal transduction histidine kinase